MDFVEFFEHEGVAGMAVRSSWSEDVVTWEDVQEGDSRALAIIENVLSIYDIKPEDFAESGDGMINRVDVYYRDVTFDDIPGAHYEYAAIYIEEDDGRWCYNPREDYEYYLTKNGEEQAKKELGERACEVPEYICIH